VEQLVVEDSRIHHLLLKKLGLVEQLVEAEGNIVQWWKVLVDRVGCLWKL
jgi:hypothetical protein